MARERCESTSGLHAGGSGRERRRSRNLRCDAAPCHHGAWRRTFCTGLGKMAMCVSLRDQSDSGLRPRRSSCCPHFPHAVCPLPCVGPGCLQCPIRTCERFLVGLGSSNENWCLGLVGKGRKLVIQRRDSPTAWMASTLAVHQYHRGSVNGLDLNPELNRVEEQSPHKDDSFPR